MQYIYTHIQYICTQYIFSFSVLLYASHDQRSYSSHVCTCTCQLLWADPQIRKHGQAPGGTLVLLLRAEAYPLECWILLKNPTGLVRRNPSKSFYKVIWKTVQQSTRHARRLQQIRPMERVYSLLQTVRGKAKSISPRKMNEKGLITGLSSLSVKEVCYVTVEVIRLLWCFFVPSGSRLNLQMLKRSIQFGFFFFMEPSTFEPLSFGFGIGSSVADCWWI